MPPKFGGPPAPKCPTCQTSVYHAEQVMGPGGKSYHRRCLRCYDCGKVLDPGSVVDHDYEAYCRPCHSKSFGPRGYGVGHSGLVGEYRPASSPNVSPQRPSGAVTSPGLPASDHQGPSSPPSRAPIFANPQLPVPTRDQLEQTFRPRVSNGALAEVKPVAYADSTRGEPIQRLVQPTQSQSDPRPSDNDDFSAPIVPRRAPLPTPPGSGRPPLPVPPPKPTSFEASHDAGVYGRGSVASLVGANVGAGRDLCPRCRGVVYAAEAVSALGCKWHKRCLRCLSCSTTLNGTNMVEKDGQPYCRRCHASATFQDQGMITRPGLF